MTMTVSLPEVNCIHFDNKTCYPHDVPRLLFMRPKCILSSVEDPRIVRQCKLQTVWPPVLFVPAGE